MITIYDWFGYDLPTEERYKQIKEAGFDGVLLWWSAFLNRDDYRNAPQAARKAGLTIENIHTPFQIEDHIWLDNLDGEVAMDCYLQCVTDCAEFEIPTMVVHLPDEDRPCNELGLKRIKKLAAKAERLGINIALENLHNLTNLTFVLEHVDSIRIGFCYDCSHHHRFYPNRDLLSMFGSRLMALHLHDFDEVNSQYVTHRLPFDGIIDWHTAMKNIRATSYTGATAIEAMNWNYKDLPIEEFLCEAHKRAMMLEEFRREEQDKL